MKRRRLTLLQGLFDEEQKGLSVILAADDSLCYDTDMFAQYRGLKKENYILFFGRMMTNSGSMIWPMMTLILNQKMGMSASQVAVVMVIGGLFMMPANLIGGKLADRYSKKMIIIFGDLVSITLYIVSGLIPLSRVTIALIIIAGTAQMMEDPPYLALIADKIGRAHV